MHRRRISIKQHKTHTISYKRRLIEIQHDDKYVPNKHPVARTERVVLHVAELKEALQGGLARRGAWEESGYNDPAAPGGVLRAE